MGVISALFVILLSISGFIIHHSLALDLDNRFIDSNVLLSWYGIEVPDISISFSSGGRTASLIADVIYFDTIRLVGSYNSLLGLMETDFGFVIATSDQLLLVTDDSQLIEVLGSAHEVPAVIDGIGFAETSSVYLKSRGVVIEADVEALSWPISSLTESQIQWSTASSLDTSTAELIKSAYSGSLLSWDRLILDVHSGRVLGSFGVLLVDIMAVLFALMAISGVWIWSRRRS